ncbi:hypothetical protein [Brenneria corticis]|uniref:Uncharacterized protein n=1 Tax=Brenneria corticis TaxID=2173106 RepID=A0A2U1TMC2_9GAMM|nr:hypothetical protein [Brenneria sp. CFCC 11842]PWC10536.1 hypothetical protein DDT56_21740 [Brenneria sp. CFCC 11842]
MSTELIDVNLLQSAQESARWAYLSMIASWVSAISAVFTAIIAIVAVRVAYKTMNSWKEQEKQNQSIRLKRAVFSYRATVESELRINSDEKKANFYDRLFSLRADILHELILAGLDNPESNEYKLFDELFINHEAFVAGSCPWNKLLDSAVALQESIRIENLKK